LRPKHVLVVRQCGKEGGKRREECSLLPVKFGERKEGGREGRPGLRTTLQIEKHIQRRKDNGLIAKPHSENTGEAEPTRGLF